jgi:hypothetical protein
MAGQKGRSGGRNKLMGAEHRLRGTKRADRQQQRPAGSAPTRLADLTMAYQFTAQIAARQRATLEQHFATTTPAPGVVRVDASALLREVRRQHALLIQLSSAVRLAEADVADALPAKEPNPFDEFSGLRFANDFTKAPQ